MYRGNQFLLTLSNFQHIAGQITFPFVNNTIIYGESGTGKSAPLQCMRLMAANFFDFPVIKNLECMGPQANFKSILHNPKKPLGITFTFFSAIGRVSCGYQIQSLPNSCHGHVCGFHVSYEDQPIFVQSNANAQIFPNGLVRLLQHAQRKISQEQLEGKNADNSALNTELLQPLTELFEGEMTNFHWHGTAVAESLPVKAKTRKHESHDQHFIPDFWNIFPNGVNFDVAEMGSKFLHNAYYSLSTYLKFNSFIPKIYDEPFTGIIFQNRMKDTFHFDYFIKQPKRIHEVLVELNIPYPQVLPLLDHNGGDLGYQLMFQTADHKLYPFTQAGPKTQRAIHFLFALMQELQEMESRVDTQKTTFVYLQHVEDHLEPPVFQKLLLYLDTHFKHIYCLCETSSEGHFHAFLGAVRQRKDLVFKSWILTTGKDELGYYARRTTFMASGEPEDFFPTNLKFYSHWKFMLQEWVGNLN